MKLNIIILPGGEIQILGDDASFEQTRQATNTLIAHLQARGLPVELIGPIERHKPDGPPHAHVVSQATQQAKQNL